MRCNTSQKFQIAWKHTFSYSFSSKSERNPSSSKQKTPEESNHKTWLQNLTETFTYSPKKVPLSILYDFTTGYCQEKRVKVCWASPVCAKRRTLAWNLLHPAFKAKLFRLRGLLGISMSGGADEDVGASKHEKFGERCFPIFRKARSTPSHRFIETASSRGYSLINVMRPGFRIIILSVNCNQQKFWKF